MGKYDWAEIQLFIDANKGLEAIEKLTGEKPSLSLVIVGKEAREKWNATAEMTDDFYKLDIQERLYESGMATRPAPTNNQQKKG